MYCRLTFLEALIVSDYVRMSQLFTDYVHFIQESSNRSGALVLGVA